MKKIYFYIFITILFLGCKDNLEKKVFYNFELGKGLKFNINRLKELQKSGEFKSNIDGYPFMVNKIAGIGEYYAAPLFFKITGDTIVSEVQVLFLTDPNNFKFGLQCLKDGDINLTIPEYSDNGLSSKMIKEDIIRNITNKYGKYNSSDTLNYEGTLEYYEWENKDGVNIQLDYYYDERIRENTGGVNRLIKLKYSYTDELFKKISKNKSVF